MNSILYTDNDLVLLNNHKPNKQVLFMAFVLVVHKCISICLCDFTICPTKLSSTHVKWLFFRVTYFV